LALGICISANAENNLQQDNSKGELKLKSNVDEVLRVRDASQGKSAVGIKVDRPPVAAGSDADTIVFVREGKDAMGQPNMILERIQADASGRSVIFAAAIHKITETKGFNAQPIDFPKLQRSPDISPLGKKILLRRGWTVSAMNWDGTGGVNLTPYPREWYDARWSPDGKKIAICADMRNLAEIYVMNFDGSDLHNLTWKDKSNERAPSWSPDGKRIAFISDRNGKFELFTMNAADGTDQTRILSLDGDIREPAWGPDKRIAFSLQKADGNAALYVADRDGGNLTQLTAGDFWDGQAAWSADGKRLAFVSNRSGMSNIWIMDVASKEMRNVTRNASQQEFFPAWVPKQISAQALEIPADNGAATNIVGLSLPRPRMLFRTEDLPGIREKFTREPYAPVWKSFLSRCDALCNPESKEAQGVEASIKAIQDNPSKGLYDRSGWILPVFDLSFAWKVTDDRKYGDCAAKWLVRIAEEYAKWHQRIVFEYPTACSYDWLHSLFKPEELKMLNRILQTTAVSDYKAMSDLYFGETKLIECNFATHTAGSVGPAFLVLSGEPGSDDAWLPAAARLTTINLNTWIGAAGDAAEGTSYFNRPVELLMPFMVSLKINNLYPETRNSNLEKFADWLAVINAGGKEGSLPAIGDSDGGALNFPIGLLRLYPDNLTVRKLWNSVKRAAQPSSEVLSLLWFEPAEGKAQDYTGLPKTAYFDNQNYQVFRTGYGDDSRLLTFTLTADGHAHLECGAITLYAFGEKLLVDAGQAVSAADCHSQLLIDGRGRFVNYQAGHANRERISTIQEDAFAAAATVNMPPAFINRDVSSHGGPTYGIPAPGIRLERGSRTVMMVGDDTTAAPPYYLLRDDARVGDKATVYEQLYVGDADEVALGNGEGSFVFGRRYAGPWLAPVGGGKGEATLDFTIAEAGAYQLWVYLREPGGSFSFRIGEANARATIGPRVTRGNCWQWVPAGNAMPLPAGKQTLVILPGGALFGKIALIPEAQAKEYSGWGELPAGSLSFSCTEAVVTGGAWKLESAKRPPAELLVTSLNSEPVEFAADTFSFRTRFYGQIPITLPRARLIKRQPDANFLTLLYPYLPGMEQPKISKGKDGAVLAWQRAIDTIRITPEEILVSRKHQDGKEELFHYRRPVF
jgi:WD40 repeat protein